VPPESSAVDWDEVPAELHVSRESRAAIEKYVEILVLWQKRINLIGPSTVTQLWKRHIVDSLQILPLLPAGSRTIAELGSGAGIPGLVIAIAGNLEAHLYESNGKKAAFLREAVRQTGAKAVVHQVRLESIARRREEGVPRVDAVVARAVAPLRLLLDYAEPFLALGAVGLFHKGQDVDAELTEATKYWNIEFRKHPSMCDSHGVILEIRKAARV
jgi:16S rRNA (guanine527-N7)-methyltransferase